MRDMFDSYSNLSDIYVPDNTTKRQNTFVYFTGNKDINREYNIKGEFIGYSWSYGDTVLLNLSMEKKIMVEEDAIVYDEYEQFPDSSTIGIKGQRAYNTESIKSWTCETLDQNIYNWVEDKAFKYPEFGTKEISLMAIPNIDLKKIKFEIKNFRKEVIYSAELVGSKNMTIEITKDIADILLQGTYSFYFTIVEEDYVNVFMVFNVIIKDSNSYLNNCGSVIGGDRNV